MENSIHPKYGNGKICYIEMPAININASASFYQKVFGWQIRQRGDGHTAFDDGVGEVSGTWVTGRTAAANPGLLVYIMVNSVAVTLELILNNGGTLVQPIGMDAPEITARFSDPAGNIIGLYQEPNSR
jgi:predicted enzyme related to lactoylglutathione lyase